MYLIMRTYIFICDSGKICDNKIVGMCLGECGLSITITSFTNVCAFMMASLIPIITLQEFARQVISYFNNIRYCFAIYLVGVHLLLFLNQRCRIFKSSSSESAQPAIKYSKLTIKTLEQGVKYVQG